MVTVSARRGEGGEPTLPISCGDGGWVYSAYGGWAGEPTLPTGVGGRTGGRGGDLPPSPPAVSSPQSPPGVVARRRHRGGTESAQNLTPEDGRRA